MRKTISPSWVGMQATAVLAVVLTTGCPPTDTATLRVWNNTGKTVTAVYCTPVTDDSWGPNLISQAIGSGETRDIRGFEPGDYDMLAVFADASEVDEFEVTFDPNEIHTWNLLLSIPSGKSGPSGVDGYIPLDPEDGGEVRLKN